MTLREWLDQNPEVAEVDYTYHAKDGNIEYGFDTVEALKKGSWDIPSDILDCRVLKADTECVDSELIAYVDVVSE
jgi:hypothetical protein